MRTPFICLLLLIPAFAHAESTTYSNADYRYTVQLPDGWMQLSNEQIRQAADVARQGIPQLNFPTYDTWFQRKDRPDYAYPYVVVNHQRCRTPILDEIRANFDRERAKAGKKAGEDLRGFAEGSTLGEPVIDTRRNAILIPVTQTVLLGDVGPLEGEMALFPGREGIAQLNFYCRKGEVASFRPAWEAMLDSFRYDNGYAYEDAFRPHRRDLDYTKMLAAGIVCGIASIFLTRFFRARGGSPGMVRLQVLFSLVLGLGVFYLIDREESGPLSLAFEVVSIVVGVAGLAVLAVRKRRPSIPGESR